MTKRLHVVAVLLLGVPLCFGEEGGPKVSKPFEYSGYTAPEYGSHRAFSEYVPMSDGVQLAVDVFVPTEGPGEGPFPVVLQYTPYRRSWINPETGEVRDLTRSDTSPFLLSYGYALVCADMRGTGASTGWLMDFMPKLAEDGKELVDWIAEQPWCDGNVGMMGGSYLGWSQTATASQRPEALKCIMPAVIPLDGYTGEVCPGGIYLQEFFRLWGSWMTFTLRNNFLPQFDALPTKPVTDEDGDGEIVDEIPVDANGDGSFLDEPFPPTYRDGQSRDHVYYRATMDHHEGDYDYPSWASKTRFVDDASPLGQTLYDLSPSGHVPGLMKSGIPMYHVGGWFDAFARGSFELLCTMAGTNPSKLLMGPGYHNVRGGPFWAHFGHNQTEVSGLFLTEHLRFFDRYLKGIENGIENEPPIAVYVMNGRGWRFLNEWPPARAQSLEFHLDAGHLLADTRQAGGVDTYTADFTHDSSYAANQANRYKGISGESPATLPLRTEKDKQCLVYTSQPLAKDTEVTGHPVVRLWVSSTADDGDFYVYLEDVGEDDEAVLVTEGQLRSGFSELYDNDRMVYAGRHEIDVLPDLPWHGFEKQHYAEGALSDGKVVELVIDFQPTAWMFRSGHRIRLSIACADNPTFALHPKLSPQNDPEAPDNIVPDITVHRTAEYPSRLELPWIPAPVESPFLVDGKVDLDAVVSHFEDLYRAESSIADVELSITTPRLTKTMKMNIWTKGEEKALILVQAPPREKGTATLKVDKNLWNYMPRIKRTVRIPPSMMLASWMGSDFTNDDLVRESSYREDYTYELVGPSTDPPGWLVRFDAKPDTIGLWKTFELIVSEDGLIPLQAKSYDRKDELARTIYWDDVKEFDGKRIPAHMTMVPTDKEGNRTEMRYLDIDFDVDIPEDTFSLSRLEQGL